MMVFAPSSGEIAPTGLATFRIVWNNPPLWSQFMFAFIALAGAFANDQGGLFVYNAMTRDEALSCLEQDPFAVNGVFSNYELLEWLVEGVNPDLLTSDVSSSR